jgi:uncharacterized protein YaaQ
MAKLLMVVVQDRDADTAINALEEAGHRVTRLASTGGLLRASNSTLVIACDDQDEEPIAAILERVCSGEDIELPLVITGRLREELPATVRYAGANIFVIPLERHRRV